VIIRKATVLNLGGRLKRVASSFVISLLFLSVVVFAFNVQPVKAPDTTIYINLDGSITPVTANITRSNSFTYTFTGNNSLPIVVNRGNIIINGMGYTLQTSATFAITVSGLVNVTIKNTNIRNNNYGIYLWSSSRCTISGNNLVSTNSTTNSTGILLSTSCNYNVISGNNITGFGVTGIWLFGASNYNTISGNRLINNGNNHQSLANGAIRLGGSTTTYGCSRNLITGNQIHGSVQAGFKIYWGSNYNTISYNNVSEGSDILEVWGCSSCKILYNNVTNGIWNGIILAYDSNITAIGNRATLVGASKTSNSKGSYGLDVEDCTNVTLSGNYGGLNTGSGTYFYNTTNSRITANNFTSNGYCGIEIDASSSITITSNNVQSNPQGIKLERNARNNVIYRNNFINNNLQANVTGAGTGNTWNAAYPTGGNCWSDYTGVDQHSGSSQNLQGSDGIGDTAYVISGTNRDNYPLMGQYPPSGLSSVIISPSLVTVDVGQSRTFMPIVSGGSLPYSYQWYLNGSAIGGATSNSYTFTPSSSGHYNFYVNVTDGANAKAQSNTATATVNSALSISVSPSSVAMDVGQSQTFTPSVSGGTSPFSYRWYLDGKAVSGATGTSYTYSPASSGSHTVSVRVTDSASTPVTAQSSSASVSVNGALSVSISPSSVTMDVDQSQMFTSSVSGGTSPFAYQWYLNDSAVSGATSASWAFAPSSSGSYSVYARATDVASAVATSNTAVVTVNSGALMLIPLSGWTVDPQYTSASYVLNSNSSSLYLRLDALNTTSKVAIFNLNVPKLGLSGYTYLDATATGTGNALVTLRFFLDDGSCFDMVYWQSPTVLNAIRFDLSSYAGRTLSGLVYVGLMSADGTTANITITQIAFETQSLPPTVPLSGWQEDPVYTNSPYVLSSSTSSLYLELDAENTTSKAVIHSFDAPKLALSDYASVKVNATGAGNALVTVRFFMDDGSCFDMVYWQSPATLNSTTFDLSPYAGRTLTGLVYVGLMSSDGTLANVTITEIALVHA
jgi:parallel beta-helix repeat protein